MPQPCPTLSASEVCCTMLGRRSIAVERFSRLAPEARFRPPEWEDQERRLGHEGGPPAAAGAAGAADGASSPPPLLPLSRIPMPDRVLTLSQESSKARCRAIHSAQARGTTEGFVQRCPPLTASGYAARIGLCSIQSIRSRGQM